MGGWYCYVKGERYGPISEEQLQGWITEGRVRLSDSIWTEGMSDWTPVYMVPEFEGAGMPFGGGTGGRTPNYELMAQARQALDGQWGLAIGVGLLFLVINMVIGAIPGGNIAQLVIGGALELGLVIFFLALARRTEPRVEMLFWGFKRFGAALGAYLLRLVFVFLWSLLLIVPGIIAQLSYSQTFYLLADHPEMGPLEAIRASKEMMRGHKWRLFCLGLRFLGWILLSILTCCIGFIFLMPYIGASYARFYEDLKPSRAGDEEKASTPGALTETSPRDQLPPPQDDRGESEFEV